MNREWFGDSYDIVKRYFVGLMKELGYSVYIEPMFTGEWGGAEDRFFEFIGAWPIGLNEESDAPSALLLDPDTGVGKKSTPQHVTIEGLVTQLDRHNVVISFDQSFSRGIPAADQMKSKLASLAAKGKCAFYYDSHARFLFVGRTVEETNRVIAKLLEKGLPENRVVQEAT